MQSSQFFTNEAILNGLGYPSALHTHDRHVVHSTKDDIAYIGKAIEELKQSAKEFEDRNNQWIKENKWIKEKKC